MSRGPQSARSTKPATPEQIEWERERVAAEHRAWIKRMETCHCGSAAIADRSYFRRRYCRRCDGRTQCGT